MVSVYNVKHNFMLIQMVYAAQVILLMLVIFKRVKLNVSNVKIHMY